MSNKVNLDILNKLVRELNEGFNLASKIKEADPTNQLDYLAEISKCMGLVSAAALEAGALTHDFMKQVKINSASTGVVETSPYGGLEDLFLSPSAAPKKTEN